MTNTSHTYLKPRHHFRSPSFYYFFVRALRNCVVLDSKWDYVNNVAQQYTHATCNQSWLVSVFDVCVCVIDKCVPPNVGQRNSHNENPNMSWFHRIWKGHVDAKAIPEVVSGMFCKVISNSKKTDNAKEQVRSHFKQPEHVIVIHIP